MEFCYQDEWRSGLKALRADTINKLKKAFPELVQEVSFFTSNILMDTEIYLEDAIFYRWLVLYRVF